MVEIFAKIEGGEYQEAVNKLQNDVWKKVSDTIDGNSKTEWIISLQAQQDIANMINKLIIYLQRQNKVV